MAKNKQYPNTKYRLVTGNGPSVFYKWDDVLKQEDGDTIPFKNKNTAHLTRDFCDDNGAFYKVDSELFRGDIWLCPVLKYLLGEYPTDKHLMFR